MKILICDDEEIILSALSFRLAKEGYEVDTVLDGKQAMDKINKNDYDLIITDIMIPFFTGLELVSMIRSTPGKEDTPIIILSGVGLEEMVLEAFQLGANDFVTKPFSPNELSLRIKNLLKPMPALRKTA